MRPFVDTRQLFPVLDRQLIELLQSLSSSAWKKQTIAKTWTVKDVAAHLLHGNIRTLSSRDKNTGGTGIIASYDDIVTFLNRNNAEWVTAWHPVSPGVLIDLLQYTGKQFCEHIATQDLFIPAKIPVAWAGETTSPNWFHIAREYTEKWHHQQQIRDAVQKPGIMTAALYGPCLQTFMLALPHTYRNIQAPEGTVLKFTITGAGGGDWYLVMNKKWELSNKADHVHAQTIIDGSVAWKLFTKSWRRNDVKEYVSVHGDQQLGAVILDMIAVMA